MNIKITSVHFKLNDELENFIRKKVTKLSNTYDRIISSDITLKIENAPHENNKIAEIRLVIPGNDLYASKQSKTFEEATNGAISALRKQLLKYKSKNRKNKE